MTMAICQHQQHLRLEPIPTRVVVEEAKANVEMEIESNWILPNYTETEMLMDELDYTDPYVSLLLLHAVVR